MSESFECVSKAAQAFYAEQGALCLRGVLNDDVLESCREGVRKNIAKPGRFFRDYTAEGSPGRYTFEFWSWQNIREFEQLAFNAQVNELIATLLGARQLTLLMDQWFRREGGATNAASWHHDEPYFDFFGGRKCVLWFPLEDVSAVEGLTFIGRSHTWGKLFMAQDFAKREPFAGDMSDYEHTSDFHAHSADYLSWNMRVGDCLVFDFRTLHRATSDRVALPNTGHRMSYRYGDQDVAFKPRGTWTDEISQYLIERGQRPGEKLACDFLPVVYSQR